MSFFNLGYSLTNINSILERDHFTLEELLDEQDVLQECSKDNKQLVDFLSKPPVLLQMLEFAIGAPDENADEAVRYKYPSVATDILSLGVYGICQGLISGEKVWNGKTLMERLWSFLDNPSPLNPLLASYFSKIAGALLQKKSADVLTFVRQDKAFLDKLLLNMGTSAIMELLTSIFGDRDLKHTDGVMEWLTEEKLVERFIERVSVDSSPEMQANASQALVEVVGLNKLTIEYLGPDPIVVQLYAPAILEMLVTQLTVDNTTATLVSNGIDIFLALMNAGQLPVTGEEQVQQLSDQSLLQLALQSADVGKVLVPYVQNFVDMLLGTNGAAVPKTKIFTTFGVLDPPLGTHRLRIVELMMAMVANSKLVEATQSALVECRVADALFDVFFLYKWNNMLHSLVERYVIGVLDYAAGNANGEALVKATLFDATLIDRMLHHIEANKNRSMGERDGFIGSLYIMANSINTFFTRKGSPSYVATLADNLSDAWREFTTTDLVVVNECNEKPLGGHRPNNNMDNDEEFDVGADCGSDINQDLAYMRFLSQQISSAPSNDDFLSSSSDEESDFSNEISDEDDGDRIFRPELLEDAFAPDTVDVGGDRSVFDNTNEVIAAAFDRATIQDGIPSSADADHCSKTDAVFGDGVNDDDENSSAETEANASREAAAVDDASVKMEEDAAPKSGAVAYEVMEDVDGNENDSTEKNTIRHQESAEEGEGALVHMVSSEEGDDGGDDHSDTAMEMMADKEESEGNTEGAEVEKMVPDELPEDDAGVSMKQEAEGI